MKILGDIIKITFNIVWIILWFYILKEDQCMDNKFYTFTDFIISFREGITCYIVSSFILIIFKSLKLVFMKNTSEGEHEKYDRSSEGFVSFVSNLGTVIIILVFFRASEEDLNRCSKSLLTFIAIIVIANLISPLNMKFDVDNSTNQLKKMANNQDNQSNPSLTHLQNLMIPLATVQMSTPVAEVVSIV